MKIFKHLKTDWFRYGFETIAVVVGILVAFALDSWNENRLTDKQLNTYTEKLINDLVTDTLNINTLIGTSRAMQVDIEHYFSYFDSGDIPLQNLLDSSKNVRPSFFRYFPINYTLIDMQSSGKIELLNEDLRKSLIELSNAQEFLTIIIEKTIEDIKMQQNEMRKYFDSDLSDSDFFEKLGWPQEDQLKRQGLLHRHSELSQFHSLAYYMDLHGARIKDLTKQCLELSSQNVPRKEIL